MNKPDEKQLLAISDWLVESAMTEQPIVETVCGFAERLVSLGVPLHRFNCSANQVQQIMGAIDCTWEHDTGECREETISRMQILDPKNSNTPIGAMARAGGTFERYDLTDPQTRTKFPVFGKLHDDGYVDYLVFCQTYGRSYIPIEKWMQFSSDSDGAYGTAATRRKSGFTDADIETIITLWRPFSLFLKTTTESLLTTRLLEAYVGRLPAREILSGLIERGDGDAMNCVLWYSDLRGSTQLSTTLPTQKYLDLLNHFYDCTAGSVMEQGGEVLKLIGDAVMAIFPCDDDQSSKQAACQSALAATRQALAKAEALNNIDGVHAAGGLRFGIGLHSGEVVLGNVGTEERLDMTVTGAAANQVTRVEALTKNTGLSVLASPQFYAICPDGLVSIGKYPVPDLGGMTEIYSLHEQ